MGTANRNGQVPRMNRSVTVLDFAQFGMARRSGQRLLL